MKRQRIQNCSNHHFEVLDCGRVDVDETDDVDEIGGGGDAVGIGCVALVADIGLLELPARHASVEIEAHLRLLNSARRLDGEHHTEDLLAVLAVAVGVAVESADDTTDAVLDLGDFNEVHYFRHLCLGVVIGATHASEWSLACNIEGASG